MIREALLALALLLAVPLGAAGQEGCPWCTTPITCGSVEEDTDIASCRVIQFAGCLPQPLGSCEFNPQEEEEDLELLLALGFTRDDLVRVETLVGWRSFVEVGEGVAVAWACNGALDAAVRLRDGAPAEWLPLGPFTDAYSVRALLTAAGASSP